MRVWFSPRDVAELVDMGYDLFEFDSEEYKIEENQTIFTREGLSGFQRISLIEIWPELR